MFISVNWPIIPTLNLTLSWGSQMPAHCTMTQDDRRELVDAAITKFRSGEYGPISFQLRLRQIGGFDQDDINALKRQHIDECCKNMRA